MLRKLRSRGSQGFTSGLQVASLHLRGIAKGRDATAPISSSRPFFYSNRSEYGYAQFPRRTLLGSPVTRGKALILSEDRPFGTYVKKYRWEGKNSAFGPCAELRLTPQYSSVESQPAGESGRERRS